MGNDTKWADVAHYYQFADIEIQIGIGQRKFKGVSQHDSVRGGAKRALFADSGGIFVRSTQYEISEYKPILRHLEDMTEAECFELASLIWGESDLIPFTRNDSQRIIKHKDIKFNGKDDPYGDCLFVVGVDGRASSWPIRMNQMTPQAVHWLISRGFDLFGLIESGQAIRKEAGNGL